MSSRITRGAGSALDRTRSPEGPGTGSSDRASRAASGPSARCRTRESDARVATSRPSDQRGVPASKTATEPSGPLRTTTSQGWPPRGDKRIAPSRPSLSPVTVSDQPRRAARAWRSSRRPTANERRQSLTAPARAEAKPKVTMTSRISGTGCHAPETGGRARSRAWRAWWAIWRSGPGMAANPVNHEVLRPG